MRQHIHLGVAVESYDCSRVRQSPIQPPASLVDLSLSLRSHTAACLLPGTTNSRRSLAEHCSKAHRSPELRGARPFVHSGSRMHRASPPSPLFSSSRSSTVRQNQYTSERTDLEVTYQRATHLCRSPSVILTETRRLYLVLHSTTSADTSVGPTIPQDTHYPATALRHMPPFSHADQSDQYHVPRLPRPRVFSPRRSLDRDGGHVTGCFFHVHSLRPPSASPPVVGHTPEGENSSREIVHENRELEHVLTLASENIT